MVLAGDIHQLRPTTKFPLFADCAPASSLQERLLKLPFYESCLPSSSKLLSTLPSNLVLGVFLSKNYRYSLIFSTAHTFHVTYYCFHFHLF